MSIDVSHTYGLVFISVLVAGMAAFTALRLITAADQLSVGRRKFLVVQAALVLGGGIWAMHFIGMLAVHLPISIAYDPLRTLASALVAIIATECALLWLEFRDRTTSSIAFAGTLEGLGITIMHYLGMSAMSDNCIPTYNTMGVVLATTSAVAISIVSFLLLYGSEFRKAAIRAVTPLLGNAWIRKSRWDRGARNLSFTTVSAILLAIAISSMHYIAMYFTEFSIDPEAAALVGPIIEPYRLAIYVLVVSFLICVLFLLTAAPDVGPGDASAVSTEKAEDNQLQIRADPARGTAETYGLASHADEGQSLTEPSVPYQVKDVTHFVAAHAIQSIRADGHYSHISVRGRELFCPWSISRLEKALGDADFMRTHRSYVVNRKLIAGFRRDGGSAVCIIGEDGEIEVPVSRTYIAKVREILGVA